MNESNWAAVLVPLWILGAPLVLVALSGLGLGAHRSGRRAPEPGRSAAPDRLMTNPLDQRGAADNLITNPLDRR